MLAKVTRTADSWVVLVPAPYDTLAVVVLRNDQKTPVLPDQDPAWVAQAVADLADYLKKAA